MLSSTSWPCTWLGGGGDRREDPQSSHMECGVTAKANAAAQQRGRRWVTACSAVPPAPAGPCQAAPATSGVVPANPRDKQGLLSTARKPFRVLVVWRRNPRAGLPGSDRTAKALVKARQGTGKLPQMEKQKQKTKPNHGTF